MRDEPLWPGTDWPTRHPLILQTPVPCCYDGCGAATRKVVHSVRADMRWLEVALCEEHLKLLRLAIPSIRFLGQNDGPMMETMPLAWVQEEVTARAMASLAMSARLPRAPPKPKEAEEVVVAAPEDILGHITLERLAALWVVMPHLRELYDSRHAMTAEWEKRACVEIIEEALAEIEQGGEEEGDTQMTMT